MGHLVVARPVGRKAGEVVCQTCNLVMPFDGNNFAKLTDFLIEHRMAKNGTPAA